MKLKCGGSVKLVKKEDDGYVVEISGNGNEVVCTEHRDKDCTYDSDFARIFFKKKAVPGLIKFLRGLR